MDVNTFMKLVEQEIAPPSFCQAPLQALWWLQKGDWHRAHELVQDEIDNSSAWVHALLHRIEGDEGNARYWYHRARRQPSFELSIEAEWQRIAANLLNSTVSEGSKLA